MDSRPIYKLLIVQLVKIYFFINDLKLIHSQIYYLGRKVLNNCFQFQLEIVIIISYTVEKNVTKISVTNLLKISKIVSNRLYQFGVKNILFC